ncbi:EAL domain-containing protein [Aquabacterium sp.]|uniref:putative bifunctional diguanylate cyclase/phosphodiesterase n=1 Tax=Aquabacterium sp. TaxID=1872578 RepID=UPI0025B7FDCC|nr:EAL domain-containing protein [Aquabacterium sp.]
MPLPFLHTGKLQVRIVAVFLGLLVAVQVATYWLIEQSIDRNARSEVDASLDIGQKVFQRLLMQNSERLAEATRVLSADYGFRSAIASGDDETLSSALQNSSERIGAAIAVYTDTGFQLKAGTSGEAARFVPAIERYALRNDKQTPSSNWVELVNGRAYQIVAVPVRAPAVIGWVGMAFPVGAQLLQDMKRLSNLDVALMLVPPDQGWQTLEATLPRAEWPALALSQQPQEAASASPQRPIQKLMVQGTEFSAHITPLASQGDRAEVVALLMQSVDEALASYRRLKVILLTISVVGVAVFGLGSVLTARHITTPLRQLTQSARRLERGDYGAAVTVQAQDEIGELAQSFETMRQGIQAREGEIRRLAYQDALTGLPNREQFRHDLRQAIARSQENGAPCAVLLMDLDRFKHVNDVLGHRFGDRLLRAVAERLHRDVIDGQQAVLARLSGDEFAVLLQGKDAEAALPVARRILHAFEQPITLDDHTVDLSAGIGVASAPAHGLEADLLLGRAELAMYAAKAQQAGTVAYHPGLDSSSEESLSLLSELRHAVDHGQMRVFLQPKIHLQSGAVLGAEALVRWEHPTRGMVPPMKFIPFAEQTGFVRVLTMWMLEQVAQLSQALSDRGLRMKIAVNLSTRDLMDQDLPTKIEQMLLRYAVDPQYLVLEITESAIMDDPQRALGTLNRLHAMGLKLSIDDFGTGYSSLAYLKRLPVNELKIDRSFVMNMESDLQDAKIVRSTIELAHNLGLTVVAEGIENAKTLKLLEGLGCDEAQGYFIAKPMPAAMFAEWAEGWMPPDTSDERLNTDFAAMIH